MIKNEVRNTHNIMIKILNPINLRLLMQMMINTLISLIKTKDNKKSLTLCENRRENKDKKRNKISSHNLVLMIDKYKKYLHFTLI